MKGKSKINKTAFKLILTFLITSVFLPGIWLGAQSQNLMGDRLTGLRVFNVRDFGASGEKSQNATRAIQRAVEACAATGGGVVEDVVISNLVIETKRHDWFWWGDGEPIHFNIKKRSEVHRNWNKEDDRPAGRIHRIRLQNILARGQGASQLTGHPDSWLEEVSIENFRLAISHNPDSPYDKAKNALEVRWARNFKLRNVEIVWEKPWSEKWENAVYLENIQDVEVENLRARQARNDDLKSAALVLNQVERAIVRGCQAVPGTTTFLKICGQGSRDVFLAANEWSFARRPVEFSKEVAVKKIRKIE